MARPTMTLDYDDVYLVLSGCRPFGTVGFLAHVESALTAEDLRCPFPFAEWRRRRARERLFRSWLDVTNRASR